MTMIGKEAQPGPAQASNIHDVYLMIYLVHSVI